jgi:hypothetical protein
LTFRRDLSQVLKDCSQDPEKYIKNVSSTCSSFKTSVFKGHPPEALIFGIFTGKPVALQAEGFRDRE